MVGSWSRLRLIGWRLCFPGVGSKRSVSVMVGLQHGVRCSPLLSVVGVLIGMTSGTNLAVGQVRLYQRLNCVRVEIGNDVSTLHQSWPDEYW